MHGAGQGWLLAHLKSQGAEPHVHIPVHPPSMCVPSLHVYSQLPAAGTHHRERVTTPRRGWKSSSLSRRTMSSRMLMDASRKKLQVGGGRAGNGQL